MSRARASAGFLAVTLVVSAGCDRPKSDVPPAHPTFNKDVAPIVFANCAGCHHPGGDAPFSLTTYADAVKKAQAIGEETLERHMPPWLPEPGDFPIAGVRRISAAEIDTIQKWVKTGTPEGSPGDLPKAPVFSSGWQLGKPDAILTMARPYVLKPGREDVYRNVIFRTSVAEDVYVRAVELKTGGSPIHHALIRVDTTTAARRRDGEGGQPGFNGMSSETLQDPDGQFLGWAPGRGPMTSPDRMPWRLPKNADIVVELHLVPSDEPVNIQPEIALYFSSDPPARVPVVGKLVSKTIDIPAGDANYVVTDRYELPVSAELIGAFPHAHYLGKEMLVTATTPGAGPRTLLHIKQWSFHWQQDYRYVTPVSLPKGTVIDMRFTYDNSSNNKENPNDPPVRVRVGVRSTDEMANLGLQFVVASPADAQVLLTTFAQKEIAANIAAGEARVRENPNSAADRLLLGGSYVQAGRFNEALPHLEAARRLTPRDAIVESYLGGAYLGLGNLPSAIEHFQRSTRLAPNDARTFVNLADALQKAGRIPEATAAFKRAVALDPTLVK
jgi:hypothetical protein